MAKIPSNGKKPDYAERLKRQRTASAVKVYIVAIVLGLLLGLAYMQRAVIITVYNSVMTPPPPPAPLPVPAPPEAKVVESKSVETRRKIPDAPPPPAKPPANIVTEPASSPRDEAKARQLLADGKSQLEVFNFNGASTNFQEAAKLRIGSALKEEARLWLHKTDEFQNATKHIGLADYAQSENAVIVETTDGGEWRGLKVKEDADTIYLQAVNDANPAAEGIQKFPIPKIEVKKVTPVPLSRRRAEFAEIVSNLESATTISHSTDYYDLVYLSKRLGLGKECMAYLNRAFDGGPGHAPDPTLGDSFRRVVVRRAIGRATLLMAGNRRVQVEMELKKLRDTLPGFAPADEEVAAFRSQIMEKVRADFQPSLIVNEKKNESKKVALPADRPKAGAVHDADIGIVVDNSRLTTKGPAAQFVDRGNSRFEEGMGIIRKYTVGVGGNKDENNRILMQARVLLTEAIDSYEEALKFEAGNHAIRDRQQTASQMVYFCNKNLIL